MIVRFGVAVVLALLMVAAEAAPPLMTELASRPTEQWQPLASVEQWQEQRPTAELIYLDFWASWCGPCQQSFPIMQQWQQQYAARGFTILTISLDGRAEDAQRFLRRVQTTLPVQWDPNAILAQHFGVQTMPQSYLLNAQGEVLATHRGFQHKDIAHLEALIQSHLP
nr:redoxin family protein [Oceanococcus sp. HetDA_MAG_MS8]